LLRNRGAQIATGKYLLFWDVDLLPSEGLLDDLHHWLDSQQRPFAIVPALYASAAGTRRFANDGLFDRRQSTAAFYDHRRDLILHLALNTSTVAITKDSFSLLGGFDERFLDHGLEDFDFLLRAALKDGSLPIPSDMFTDVRHQSPAFSSGFRSILNLLSLPLFLEGIVTLHQWHERPVADSYYASRGENWRLLEENVRASLLQREPASVSPDWQSLMRDDGTLDSVLAVRTLVRQARCPPRDCSALFDEVPQHYFHTNRRLWQLRRGLERLFARIRVRS
jgi:predicted glycosyltransferase involved in capsule biosynthesis